MQSGNDQQVIDAQPLKAVAQRGGRTLKAEGDRRHYGTAGFIRNLAFEKAPDA
ncbi:MAG: hypothetical protein BWY73_01594 [candidate division TA06 bacterium ADurb.Bin417]|uniref:Uncharacterized protein n=1 Tax=candidate division TA06 bacterium ADurb.Bin417 TaxID=1852828 RepID=A0A1V5M7R6_UNCT6|nr:MAG: hypothetical protein BWY73_01594 [candidate division TA06 bacterium ADurb.Bin417]